MYVHDSPPPPTCSSLPSHLRLSNAHVEVQNSDKPRKIFKFEPDTVNGLGYSEIQKLCKGKTICGLTVHWRYREISSDQLVSALKTVLIHICQISPLLFHLNYRIRLDYVLGVSKKITTLFADENTANYLIALPWKILIHPEQEEVECIPPLINPPDKPDGILTIIRDMDSATAHRCRELEGKCLPLPIPSPSPITTNYELTPLDQLACTLTHINLALQLRTVEETIKTTFRLIDFPQKLSIEGIPVHEQVSWVPSVLHNLIPGSFSLNGLQWIKNDETSLTLLCEANAFTASKLIKLSGCLILDPKNQQVGLFNAPVHDKVITTSQLEAMKNRFQGIEQFFHSSSGVHHLRCVIIKEIAMTPYPTYCKLPSC
ncbi:MAG: hypothetical protein RLZZ453_1295 [Chlamydiota bacterium]|jgi:hypothetical protein